MTAPNSATSDSSIPASAYALLNDAIRASVDASAFEWYESALARAPESDRALYSTVSLASRKLGKADLVLSEAQLERADEIRRGWQPGLWSVDQTARVCLLLSTYLADGDGDKFAERLTQLCNTADVGELVAFYQGLPIYPEAARYRARAAEGIRTNMRSVFEAVAHRNPYPSEQLDETAWNQMVLKVLFVGTTLDPVEGLEQRANADLTRMLCDYAEERWSASRPVSPELWRCVAMAADERARGCLVRALEHDDQTGARGAALSIHDSSDPTVRALLDAHPQLKTLVTDGALTWSALVE